MKHEHLECYRRAQKLVEDLRGPGKADAVRENYARLHGLDLNKEEDIRKVRALGKGEMIEAIAKKSQENCAALIKASTREGVEL